MNRPGVNLGLIFRSSQSLNRPGIDRSIWDIEHIVRGRHLNLPPALLACRTGEQASRPPENIVLVTVRNVSENQNSERWISDNSAAHHITPSATTHVHDFVIKRDTDVITTGT